MAKLKRKLTKLEEVEEGLRGAYRKAETGEYVLDADEDERVTEFRENNRKLFGELSEAKTKLDSLKDVDPEKYKKGMEALKAIEEGELQKLLKDGKLEEVLGVRTRQMKEDYERQMGTLSTTLKNIEKERDSYKSELELQILDREVMKAAKGVGKVRPEAEEDLLGRARNLFTIDKEKKVTLKRDEYGKDGKKLSLESWAAELLERAPHFYEGSKGGNADTTKNSVVGGKMVIDVNDARSIGKYAKEIASGEAIVR